MTSKRFASREEMLKTISNQALQDSEMYSNKKRFALFSFKTPTAISDTQFIKKFPPTDENHRVIIEPRNVQTTCVKSGKIKSSYFSQPGFITLGDPYIDPERKRRLDELGSKLKTPKDQPTFKPQNSFQAMQIMDKRCGKAPYQHQTDFKGNKPKPLLDNNNKVITGPNNILVAPYGGPKFPPQIKDEFERQRVLRRKEQLEHEQLLKDKQPFRTWDIGNKHFYSDKKTYNADNLPKKIIKKPIDLHIMKHDQVFIYSNPPKKGYNKTINKFPPYMENPLKFAVRHDESEEDKKDQFKLNHPLLLTAPSPTVSCNIINLRKEIASTSNLSFKN